MRNKRIDVLRGIAIILVLGAHRYLHPLWLRAGPAGVDLFFVLSGFLISGLLFKEYSRNRAIRPGRFLIRRGLKIYPAFYFFALVTILLRLDPRIWPGGSVGLSNVIAELCFLQNYTVGLWGHTWSLAAEEHFYLALVVWFWLVSRSGHGQANPYTGLPINVLIVNASVLGLRFLTALYLPKFSFWTHNFPTHLRIDSLLFGVLLGYLYHYHQAALATAVRRFRWTILPVTAICILPALLFSFNHLFAYTFGYTALYLGFGGVLLLSITEAFNLRWPLIQKGLAKAGVSLAYIGRYSYSIYLWHYIFADWGIGWLERLSPWHLHYALEFALYFIASLALGVVMTKLIEAPFLRWRDKHFAERSGPRVSSATELNIANSPISS